MHLRDPLMYRIMHQEHHRTGNQWCIYPMYDFAHGQCDYFEGITHSLCTLEFEIHRPLYDWFVDQLKPILITVLDKLNFRVKPNLYHDEQAQITPIG
jgi:glutamyl/glutaminyl-tRNA synthetase